MIHSVALKVVSFWLTKNLDVHRDEVSKTSRVEGKQIKDLISDPKGSVIKSMFSFEPGI